MEHGGLSLSHRSSNASDAKCRRTSVRRAFPSLDQLVKGALKDAGAIRSWGWSSMPWTLNRCSFRPFSDIHLAGSANAAHETAICPMWPRKCGRAHACSLSFALKGAQTPMCLHPARSLREHTSIATRTRCAITSVPALNQKHSMRTNVLNTVYRLSTDAGILDANISSPCRRRRTTV